MPATAWNGTLSFGLVAVPVSMISATRELDVRFHQVDGDTGERIRVRRICDLDGAEVSWEEIGHGYDLDGRLVALTDEELAAVAPERNHTIEIEEFVELEAIDPAHFVRAYYLVPGSDSEGSVRAFGLLRDALAETDQVAVGRMVLRSSEHLVGVREHDGLLALLTLRFADELRGHEQIAGVASSAATAPGRGEVQEAVRLIEAMTRDFDPAAYEDRDRSRILALLEGKRANASRPPEPQTKPGPTPDLMAALKRSLERARGDS